NDDKGKDGDGDDDDNGDDGEEGDNDGDDEDDDDEEGNDDDDQKDERDDGEDDKEDEGGDDDQASDEKEFIHLSLSTHSEEETRDEKSFDHIPKTPKNSDDEGNGEEDLGEEDELYRDVNINQGRGIQMTQEVEDSYVTLTPVNPNGQQQSSPVLSQYVTSMLNPTPDARMESIFETTSQIDVQTPNSVAPLPMSASTITSSTIATITATQQAPLPPTIALSTLLQDLSNFGSLFGFDNRLKTL
nr:hypothetical protein [Tanacetum cinerariifolium]